MPHVQGVRSDHTIFAPSFMCRVTVDMRQLFADHDPPDTAAPDRTLCHAVHRRGDVTASSLHVLNDLFGLAYQVLDNLPGGFDVAHATARLTRIEGDGLHVPAEAGE